MESDGQTTVPADGDSGTRRYSGAWLAIDEINVLPQTRQTFESIPELASSIKTDGLLNPVTVVCFDPADAQEYLRWWNKFWGETPPLSELRTANRDGKTVFYILLAGERRLRAHRHLRETGDARERLACATIEVRLVNGVTPLKAARIQLAENIHVAVPPHQEAMGYWNLWQASKADPTESETLTLTGFAQSVGRSEEKVRNALRYAQLPPFIRKEVEGGQIKYGIALQLARLQAEGMDEGELGHRMLICILDRWDVPRLENNVNEWIRDKRSGQVTLLDVFADASAGDSNRAQYRRIVEGQTLQSLYGNMAYTRKVLRLIASGELNSKDSPFCMDSVLRVLGEWAVLLLQVAADIEGNHPHTAARTEFAAERALKVIPRPPEEEVRSETA